MHHWFLYSLSIHWILRLFFFWRILLLTQMFPHDMQCDPNRFLMINEWRRGVHLCKDERRADDDGRWKKDWVSLSHRLRCLTSCSPSQRIYCCLLQMAFEFPLSCTKGWKHQSLEPSPGFTLFFTPLLLLSLFPFVLAVGGLLERVNEWQLQKIREKGVNVLNLVKKR